MKHSHKIGMHLPDEADLQAEESQGPKLAKTLILILVMAILMGVSIWSWYKYGDVSPPASEGDHAVKCALTAEQGDFIYYANDNDYGRLYRVRKDGSGRACLSDDFQTHAIAVAGDWIYYGSGEDICKIRTDGSERYLLNNDGNSPLYVAGDWIYYSSLEDMKLYKMHTDGNDRIRLTNEGVLDVEIAGEWIYYQAQYYPYTVSKIHRDGSGKVRLDNVSAGVSNFNVVGDWIYYGNAMDGYKLYKASTDGSKQICLSNSCVSKIDVEGKWIYYIDDLDSEGGKIYKIHTDGSGLIVLTNDDAYSIGVIDDWIYYEAGNYREIYKISADGNENSKVE